MFGEWKASSESVSVVLFSSALGSSSECDDGGVLLPDASLFKSGSVLGAVVPSNVSSSWLYVLMNMNPYCAGAE